MTAPTLPTLARLATRAVKARDLRAKTLEITAKLVRGDLWAGGEGWTGPLPTEATPEAIAIVHQIERALVGRNMLDEVLDRHTSSVIGREPAWSVTVGRELAEGEDPTADEAARLREATAALTAWVDERDAWQGVYETVYDAGFAERSPHRVFVPEESLENGAVPREPLVDVILRIHAHHPDPTQAGLVRSNAGVVQGAWYAWKTDNALPRLELHEVVNGVTLVHTDVAENGDAVLGSRPNAYRIGGLLLMHEVVRKPLITDAVLRQHKLLTKGYTMLSRNVDLGGFLERTILNAQMPGEWKADDTSPTKKRWVPGPYNVGAGVTNFVTGIQVPSADGKTTLTTPQVVYNQPVAVSTFTDTIDKAEAAILTETKQLHVLLSKDANSSGRSRIQATNDFVASLEPTARQVERIGRWLLTTVLRLAAIFAGTPGRYDDLRVRVQARVSAVQPTAEDVKSAIELRNAGFIATETGRLRAGIEDPGAERDLITTEDAPTVTRALEMARVGIPMSVVLEELRLAGVTSVTSDAILAQIELESGGMDPPVTGDDGVDLES